MAKKIINVNKPNDFINTGSAPNARDGDSLRSSFARLNDAIDNIDANFTEVYALATGGTLNGTLEIDIQGSVVGDDSSVIVNASNSNVNAAKVTAGAIEITGSTISTTDSSTIIIDQATTVTSNLTVGGDIVPTTNLSVNLGSPTRKFHSLYVGTGSVYIGDARLSLEGNTLNSSVGFATNNLIVGGVSLSVTNTGKLGASGGFDLTDTQIDDVLPSQTGNAGKFLTTDGANNLSWGAAAGGSGSSLVNGSKTVSLGSDGNLTLPLQGKIMPVGDVNSFLTFNYGDDIELKAGDNLYLSGSVATIRTNGNANQWSFGTDGKLTLPAGGDILNSSGQSVLGGGSNSYTPDDSANWNDPTVNTVAAALDELAAKVAALENFEIDGGNAYTPAAGELIIDGNGA